MRVQPETVQPVELTVAAIDVTPAMLHIADQRVSDVAQVAPHLVQPPSFGSGFDQ